MKDQTRERWQELCEQAATETSPDTLMKLVPEIMRLLDEKYTRLNREPGRVVMMQYDAAQLDAELFQQVPPGTDALDHDGKATPLRWNVAFRRM